MRRLAIISVLGFFATAGLRAQQPGKADDEFFEKRIRPLLVDNCFKCHSGPKLKGHLALDSRVGMLKGGDSGPVLTPGVPGKSLLVKAIGYADTELRMPPRGKLSDQQIADITTWIGAGAHWAGADNAKTIVKKDFNLKERSGHWSLLPIKAAAPPTVNNQAWVRSPIDAFLLAKLEENGLTATGQADKSTLIRRVTFDLIGLPPTPEEIDAFLSDHSANAFAKVVERLLASPHYGERWARHWLDLARYAETLGHEFDVDLADAWRYRDYVIRAFNADLPYTQFVTEQLAGDLLPNPRRDPVTRTNESILGTGFWFLGEAKHSPVDARADQADRIDNQIDVFSKTFLGMTVACARCHDHKFDAITTKDYYALAGFMQSSRQQRAFIDDPAPRLIKIRRLRAVQEKAAKLAITETVSFLKANNPPLPPLRKGGSENLASHPSPLAPLPFADGRHGGFRDWLATGEAFGERSKGSTVTLNFKSPLTVTRVQPASAGRSDSVLASLPGALRSPTFIISKKKIHYRAAGSKVRVNLVLDGLQLIRDPIYGGLTFEINTKQISKTTETAKGRDFGAAPQRSFEWHTMDVSMWVGQRAYIEVIDEGPGQVCLDRVVFSDSGPPAEGVNPLVADLETDLSSQEAVRYRHLVETIIEQWSDGTLDAQPDAWARIDLLNHVLAAAARATTGKSRSHEHDAAWLALNREYEQIGLPLPPATRALAITDGTPVDECVFIRGNPKNLGSVVPRRFLEVFGGANNEPPADSSGRLQLAQQLLDPVQTPIVPRVLVNRLWQHHFAQGIVRSPDDFGLLGQAPTHPELLDFLAAEFVKSGWSIKHMHRLMVLSSAYQMQSRSSADADVADPDNKLLHKMPVRRLEAEAIHDALLAVSGRLDKTLFGPSVPPYLTPFMVGRGRPTASGPLDGNGRRGIYLGVRRNFLNPMFVAFDYPTPFSSRGKRSVSNVPAQALTMMNNPLVAQQAELWASHALAERRATTQDRIIRMYREALGRPPSASELADAAAFVEEQVRLTTSPDETHAWADLGHVLFNLKEFIYVN